MYYRQITYCILLYYHKHLFNIEEYKFLENGEIYEWDMNTRTCIKKFMDDGCLQGTSLALSSDDQFLATGSSSGVVNLYKLPCDVNPKPEKTILNLVTTVSKLCFNKNSDILAMASNQKNDAIKLVIIFKKNQCFVSYGYYKI